VPFGQGLFSRNRHDSTLTENTAPVGFNVPSDGLPLAGFQVIMYGRFGVITEAKANRPRIGNSATDMLRYHARRTEK
jgi:hypothetical protein